MKDFFHAQARAADIWESHGVNTPSGLFLVSPSGEDGDNDLFNRVLNEAKRISPGESRVVSVSNARQLSAALSPLLQGRRGKNRNKGGLDVLVFRSDILRSDVARALLSAGLMDKLLCAIVVGERLGPPTGLSYCFKVVRLRALFMPDTAIQNPAGDDDVDWTSLGGLVSVKKQLVKALQWPIKYGETMRRLGVRTTRGILLHGPPGCGKTSLVKAIARTNNYRFVSLSPADVYSCYVGEAERIVREAFADARSKNVPTILFMDEIDAIAGTRSVNGRVDVGMRVLATLLTEIDGVELNDKVVVVAATNRIHAVDPALKRPGRFGDDVIHVDLPDAHDRADIARLWCNKGIPLADGDTDTLVDKIAQETEGMNGAQVAGVCKEAALSAAREHWNRTPKNTNADDCAPRKLCVEWRHFQQAFQVARR